MRSLARFPAENPDPVLRIANDGEILYANHAGRLVLGDRVSENRVVAPDSLRQQVEEVVRSQSVKKIESRHGDRVFSLTIVPHQEAGYVNMFGSDITDSKLAQEELLKAREREALHVEQTPLGVIEWNLDFEVAAWNPAAERIFGHSTSEAMGRHASLILPESVESHVDTVWEQLLSQKGGARSTNENIPKDGATILCEWFNTPLVDTHGNVIAVASLVEDVTEQRQTQAALEESNRRLEETLTELRSTQEQVIRQERLQALGTMASGVAHDFNNALGPILGYSDILLTYPEALDDKGRATEYVRTINTSAKDAAAVVDRLREFYRQREDTEVMQPVNLNQAIREVISLTQPRWKGMAQAKGGTINLLTELHSNPPLIEGDESNLRTALTNLVLNAVDAMPKGGTLTISTRPQGEWVRIGVSDTGTGMTEDVRRRALEPFFTTKGEDGTGLGLAMVLGIVERHGGKIDIQR